jgi:sugar/nucleoside kinase (ribokinase family)
MPLTPSSRPYDVITFGDLCVDLIITGDDVVPQFGQVEKLVGDYTLEMGGSCSIFACQAARLGLRTAILGRVGDDGFGRLVLQRLQEAGVDTRFVEVDPNLKTGIGVALAQGSDRAILTYMGSINVLTPADVTDELLSSARHLHHGSYYLHTGLRPGIPDIFQRARRLGLTTSLDTNWDPEETWLPGLAELLPWVDLFMPNDAELERISGRSDLLEGVDAMEKQGIGITVVKQGARGAAVFSRGQRFERGVTPVSGGDSVGAGDSFDAGFLAGWLREYPFERCLEIATACGSSVASRHGGLAGQLTWEQVNS